MTNGNRVLITGGAGFIGSHLAALLSEAGYAIRVFDILEPQVHGEKTAPDNLPPSAEFIRGDVNDREALARAIEGMDMVVHFAAVVGIGQSQYEIARYVNTNVMGTARLLDVLAEEKHSVRKLLVASSMSMYGEGLYLNPETGEQASPRGRGEEQMAAGEFELVDPLSGAILKPLHTPESKALNAENIYALNKKHQEEYCLLFGRIYGIPAVVTRFFSVYGRGQSLRNPYTGAASIFCSQLHNEKAPTIYEDGGQTRDFVHVSDAVRACRTLLEDERADGEVFNVGSGEPTTILGLAEQLIEISGKSASPDVLGQFRKGDIRHCFADTSKIEKLGFRAEMSLEDGLRDLYEWSLGQETADFSGRANDELRERNLLRSSAV